MVGDLGTADSVARRSGFSEQDRRLATFAVVGYVDETILNVRPPALSDWLRKPLETQLFGTFIAGKVFYQNLQVLLQRPDSNETIDLIELYGLCILLGYQGQFAGSKTDLRVLSQTCMDKVRRFRNASTPLTQGLLPGSDAGVTTRDPWRKRLLWFAAVSAFVCLLLFGGYKAFLISNVDALPTVTGPTR
jgi:type VI secretion system protein ImpK